MAYLLVDYARLPAMFPWLRPFQVGKIFVGVSAVGLLLSAGRFGASRRGIRRLDIALLCFILASFLSACFAEFHEPAWHHFVDNTFKWCVIYFLVSRVLNSSWRIRAFVLFLLLLNLKLAQFAVRKYFAGLVSGIPSAYMAVHGVGAASGFFDNASDFGVAMCVVWPLAALLFVGETKKMWRLFFGVCFVAFLGGIVVTGSRGAMLGAGVVALASQLKSPKRVVGVAMILAVALTFVYLMPEAGKARMRSALEPRSDPTASIRLRLWEGGLKMFFKNPILGVGPATFGMNYLREYPESDPNPRPWAPHSIYIQALSELGLAGTVPLVFAWLIPFRLNRQTRRHLLSLGPEGKRTFEYRLSLGLDLAVVGYLVTGGFITVLYYPHLWILLGLVAGLHSICLRKPPEQKAVEGTIQEKRPALAT